MKIKPLVEEFKTSIKKGDKYYEIFFIENGESFKSEELKLFEKFGMVRFCLDLDNDTLYVWDANLLHEYVARKLDLEYGVPRPKKHIIMGESGYSHGTFRFVDSFSLFTLENSFGDEYFINHAKKFKPLIEKSKSIKYMPELKIAVYNVLEKAYQKEGKTK